MSDYPFVSIILAIRNESPFIQSTLTAILNQDYPQKKMEIIIAEGRSIDDTLNIISQIANIDKRIKIIDNPSRIVAAGLNYAIRASKGEIIIRMDGHTRANSDYVKTCVEKILSSGADNVGGRMNAVGSSSMGNAVAVATSSLFGVGGSRFHYSMDEEWVDSVYLGAWRKEVFSRIGLFDEELVRNQDDELNYRLRKNGGRILLSPEIKSEYSVRSNFLLLGKQYYQYGLWKVRVLQKHPKQMSLRHFIPASFVSSMIVTSLLISISKLSSVLLITILLSYLILNLIASIISLRGKSKKIFYLLPITYAILHISYGTGFLSGLVKFRARWKEMEINNI